MLLNSKLTKKILLLNFFFYFIIVCTTSSDIKLLHGYENIDDDGEEQMVETDEETFKDDLKNFIENGKRSNSFDKVVDAIREDGFSKVAYTSDSRAAFPSLRCMACRGTLGYFITRRRLGDSKENLARSATMMCRLGTSFSQEVCQGLINLNINQILFIIDSRPNLNQKSICSLILQPECGELDESLNFKLDISAPSAKSTIKSIQHSPSENIKIIQFTDIHFDPLYIVGGDANCNDSPLCCRKPSSSSSPNDKNKAGYWGDYRKCDMPWHTVENAIRHIAEQHKDADFVYFTGDFVPHNVWETSIESNIDVMDRMYKLMKDAFGSKAVYPILGNHEAHPVNVFAPSSITQENFSNQWLFNHTATTWSYWLPEEAMQTILNGGYYTVVVKPGFRIIALNNNDCYIFNWWILYSIEDVKAQLQWLHDTLLDAERNNEKAHILAHIASGEGSCFKYWSREYRRIVERFYRVIGAQFNGHSHFNEFNIFYATNNVSNPINAAWNGGSLTTFYDVNPNYNVYYVHGNNFHVNDYESWIFNLTEANQNSMAAPQWFRHYSFKENFKIPDLSPSSLDNLLTTMITSRKIAWQYFQYKYKDGDPSLKTGCQDDCLRNHVCVIAINEAGDDRKCKELLKNTFTED